MASLATTKKASDSDSPAESSRQSAATTGEDQTTANSGNK